MVCGVINHKADRFVVGLNLFLFFLSVFFLTSSLSNVHDTDAASDRYETTKALVERHDLSIPSGLGVTGLDGRNYSCYGIGWPVLTAPAYLIGKYFGTPEGAVSLMNQVVAAGSAVLVFFFSVSLGYSLVTSVIVSVFFGLGTIVWPLSKHPFDHSAETFFILLAVFFMYIHQLKCKLAFLLFSAFALGIALLIRYTSILMFPSVLLIPMFDLLKKRNIKTVAGIALKKTILFSAALLPFIGLALWYNNYRFGSVFETGFSLMAARGGQDLLWSMTSTPFLTGMKGLLISPGKSFFLYSPVAALFFPSIRQFAARHAEVAACFVAGIISYLLFHAKFGHWSGDWAWGPRYLLAVTPFFIIPTAELVSCAAKRNKPALKLFLSAFFLVSLCVQIAAVTVNFQNYFVDLNVIQKVKFNITRNEGVPSTCELPIEVYFDWRRSPILAQLRFIRNISGGIRNYHYSEPPADAPPTELIKSDIHMNVFDFWWLYDYFLGYGFLALIIPICLILVAGYAAANIRKSLCSESCRK